VRGEILSADISGIAPYKKDFKEFVESEGLSGQQLYNGM